VFLPPKLFAFPSRLGIDFSYFLKPPSFKSCSPTVPGRPERYSFTLKPCPGVSATIFLLLIGVVDRDWKLPFFRKPFFCEPLYWDVIGLHAHKATLLRSPRRINVLPPPNGLTLSHILAPPTVSSDLAFQIGSLCLTTLAHSVSSPVHPPFRPPPRCSLFSFDFRVYPIPLATFLTLAPASVPLHLFT